MAAVWSELPVIHDDHQIDSIPRQIRIGHAQGSRGVVGRHDHDYLGLIERHGTLVPSLTNNDRGERFL